MQSTPGQPITGINSFAHPHFGWRSEKLPDFRLAIRPEDILNGQPTDTFVRRVMDKLKRDSLDDPGFVVVPGADQVFDNPEAMKAFFENTFLRVTGMLTKKPAGYETVFPPEVSRDDVTIATQHVDDGSAASKFTLIEDRDGNRWTPKYPHFDLNPLFFAHLYHKPENISGGRFRVFDVEQRLQDFPDDPETGRMMASINQVRDPDGLKEKLLESYSYEADPEDFPAFVMVNNNHRNLTDRHLGVAHGASPVVVLDHGKPFSRTYDRWSVTRKRNSGTEASKEVKTLDIPA